MHTNYRRAFQSEIQIPIVTVDAGTRTVNYPVQFLNRNPLVKNDVKMDAVRFVQLANVHALAFRKMMPQPPYKRSPIFHS
jgi:hypothetical protein